MYLGFLSLFTRATTGATPSSLTQWPGPHHRLFFHKRIASLSFRYRRILKIQKSEKDRRFADAAPSSKLLMTKNNFQKFQHRFVWCFNAFLKIDLESNMTLVNIEIGHKDIACSIGLLIVVPNKHELVLSMIIAQNELSC